MSENETGFRCPICGSYFNGTWFSFPIGERLAFRQCSGNATHIYFITDIGKKLSEIIRQRAERIAYYKPVHANRDEMEIFLYFSMSIPVSMDKVEKMSKKYLDLINIIIKEEKISLINKISDCHAL